MSKVLFILKRKEHYGPYDPYPTPEPYPLTTDDMSGSGLMTGLYNSAKFVADMLNVNGIEAKIVVVTDNNDIDREVHDYKPTHVIIEALWVVPSKFSVLIKLHPTVKWFIRLHSAIPFLSNEGIAMQWIFDYTQYQNVAVSCNDIRLYRELDELFEIRQIEPSDKLFYQPNFYPLAAVDKHF